MNEENFLVKFVPSKDCFLQFSTKWFYKINNQKNLCLRLTNPVNKQKLYFSWAPQPAHGKLNDCSVGISATFAQALNIQEGELVVISSLENIPSAHRVFLTPVTLDDYEILELSRDTVELSLLNQIRVVFISQVIVVWVSRAMHLKLTVDCLEPNSNHGRLEESSELVIQNASRSVESGNLSYRNTADVSQIPNDAKPKSFYRGLLADYIPKSIFCLLDDNDRNFQQEKGVCETDTVFMVCRVHPIPTLRDCENCSCNVHNKNVHPFNVYVSKQTLLREAESLKNSFFSGILSEQHGVVLCRVDVISKRKLKSKKTVVNNKEELTESNPSISVCVRLCRIEDSCSVVSRKMNISCVFVSKFLQRVLDLDIGERIRIRAYKPLMNKKLSAVTLSPVKKLNADESEALAQQFKRSVSSRDGVLVNNNCPFPLPQPDMSDFTVLVTLFPGELDCWPLTHTELQLSSVTVAAEAEKSLESLRGYEKDEEKRSQISSVFVDLCNEGISALEYGLNLVETQHQAFPTNTLISGKPGSGKSRLAEAIFSAISGEPYYVFVSVLYCRSLRGKKPESIAKILTEKLEECLRRQPSVLVLEDLECIASSSENDLEPTLENMYNLRVATVLKELLWLLRTSRVVVIATAVSRSSIHPQLVAVRGRHSFSTFLQIPLLSKVNRLSILNELVCERLTMSTLPDLDVAAACTEGCVARDLHRLVDRLLFTFCQHRAQAAEVTRQDLSVALEGFVPSQLINVAVSRQSTLTFANVGGLHDAKRQLTEVLIWPNKYPEVFSQCPLRLERGALLYGAPGTGKTLLASAVVGESGLNFITVKGPELLSKYIGASEEAVRNVFEKAQSARPCILFFDEFDSLAPRRGHDSTGVTDRVVNQLLTQMDGVESLEGVWVVAAASRPDLLDPALLRPGRLGNLIHCPLPDKVEREEILQTLSKKLQLSDDVDFGNIASKTDGYTGADLQAVLFTAQMIAYDALHQDSDDDFQTSAQSSDDVVVTQSNIISALQDTFPSLKVEDRIRFQQIYEQFQKFKESPSQVEHNLRVTLA